MMKQGIVEYPFKCFTKNRMQTNRTLTFYESFVFFFMYRNYISLFPYFWRYSFFNDSSCILFKGIVTDSQQVFIILTDMLSYPGDLLESNDFNIDNIPLFVTRKELILVLVLYKARGNTLLFFIGVHVETKELLKRFAFLQ